VNSDTFDNNDSNNADDAVVDAIAADLAISKVVDNPTPDLGEQVVWTIEVENKGPDTAENVIITDTLPAGTSFVSSTEESFNAESGEIVVGDLAPGTTFTFDIVVTVDDADGARTNTAVAITTTVIILLKRLSMQ